MAEPAAAEAVMTPEERALRRRIRDDYPFFASRCLTIRTKSGSLERMKFNRAQLFMHAKLEAQQAATGMVRALALKGRQQGISTYIAGRYYHKVTHRVGAKAFILSHLADTTDVLFDVVDRFHENNNPLVKPMTGASNAKELAFPYLEAGYRVGTAGSANVGVGDTIQFFHGSEAALWADAESIASGVLQAVPNKPGTEVILESTARGLGNYFADQWALAVAGKSQFQAIFIPWFWDEGYRLPVPADFEITEDEVAYRDAYGLDDEQIVWRRVKIIELVHEWKFKQEYPATPEEAFQSSGEGNYIQPQLVAAARRIKVIVGPYIPTIIGVDPARGGRDATGIIDRQGRRAGANICERWNILDAPTLVGKLLLLLKRVKPKRMVIDATEGLGGAICDLLIEQGWGETVVPVKFSQQAIEDDLYANKRAEMYAAMLEWLKNPLGVQLPDDDNLQMEICAPIWGPGKTRHNSQSKLIIEPKDLIIKRLKHSPDLADALAMTFAVQLIQPPNTGAPTKPHAGPADAGAGY